MSRFTFTAGLTAGVSASVVLLYLSVYWAGLKLAASAEQVEVQSDA